MEAVPWGQFGIGSGWALVALFVWLVLTGRLIPKTTHDRELDQANHDATEWRAEGRIKDAQIAEKDVQLSHVREVGKTVNAIMRSIGRNANGPREEG